MRVYVAGSFDQQLAVRQRAELLEAAGFEVTSTWLNEPPTELPERTDWFMRACGALALADEQAAEALVLYADSPSSSGGYWVELGIALQRAVPIVVVGMRTPGPNVFMHLTAVKHVRDTGEAIAYLQGN
jgi:hypothetical protein